MCMFSLQIFPCDLSSVWCRERERERERERKRRVVVKGSAHDTIKDVKALL